MTDITVGYQYTKNLGNFESVKVNFGITDTVRDGESVDAAKNRINDKVVSWVVEALKEIDAESRA